MNDVVPQFSEKFIAFIDILGFKDLLNSVESGRSWSLQRLLDITKLLEGPQAGSRHFIPTICPCSSSLGKDAGMRITRVSDCSIISAEVSPLGAINIVFQCHAIVMSLMRHGLMCRGYVTKGLIYHEGSTFHGSGYHRALDGEKNVTVFRREADERGTPFIEVDESVCDYLNGSDSCVRMMAKRMLKMDGKVGAIFPFEALIHSFAIRKDFNAAKEASQNDVVRGWILSMKASLLERADPNNSSATRKPKHYLAALDKQLEQCDGMDRSLGILTRPFPGG